jgi:hypothetical protein
MKPYIEYECSECNWRGYEPCPQHHVDIRAEGGGMNQRTGKECKKTDCVRHNDYKRWQCGTLALNVCMNCKWSHVSQFERKPNAGSHRQEEANQ